LPLTFPPAGATSHISSLEARLAGSVPVSEVSRLQQEHEERIKGLQGQAGRAQELEVELAKDKEAESTLWQEFEQWLANEKKNLAAKYDSEVDELRTAQDAKDKRRDAKV
jgi:hypothetical protein